ncbi:F0F1 ATP synthase subunit B [Caulobacter sp. DWR3-1-2]|uniref:F0F1 ATP synthase subunit B n=1 Tax=Caulobacter sp. DWR3-1-2 TaxID=2804647 RepID=UPI003CF98834
MPAFFEGEFWNLANPEFWVGVGLVLFFAIVIWAKAPALIAGKLDETANKIQSDLDEAARIRTEAEAMLATIRAEREESERQAVAMLAAAKADVEQMAIEAKAKLEEQIKRRAEMAERKIAQAETQAQSEVKAAAVDLAAQIAEQVLVARLAAGTSDNLVDAAIGQIGTKLQ